MKCPLIKNVLEIETGETKQDLVDCLKEECACWSPLSECCSVRDLPGILIALGNVLGRIHDELCLSKYTYRCHYCGVTIERTEAGGFKVPAGWIRFELVDGRHVWICELCRDQVEG